MVTLGVRDIARAATFYRRLGWEESTSHNRQTCFFLLNGMTLALYPQAALASDRERKVPLTQGVADVSLSLSMPGQKEVDRLIRRAEQAGATILRRPGNVFWGGYSAYFCDLDGHMWEATYNPFVPSVGDTVLIVPMELAQSA